MEGTTNDDMMAKAEPLLAQIEQMGGRAFFFYF